MDLLVKAIAVWRIAHMLLNESGPFSVFKRVREALGVVHDQDGAPLAYKYEITVCIWCLSVWVGFAAWFVPARLLTPFVFSAFAGVVDKLLWKR